MHSSAAADILLLSLENVFVTAEPAPIHVVFCQCSRANLHNPQVRQGAWDAIANSGETVHVVDDLCELSARRDPRLAAWASQPSLVVAACFDRAVRSLFAAAQAPLNESATVVNLRSDDAQSIDRLAQTLPAAKSAAPDGRPDAASAGQRGAPSAAASGAAWYPWFPVIDYDRCVNCKQCLSFCLFGVYAMAEGKVRVVQPEKCKTNCPACARVCPQMAIIFPKFKDRPINGDQVRPEDLRRKDVKIDVASLAKGDLRQALAHRGGALPDVSLADLQAKAGEFLARQPLPDKTQPQEPPANRDTP